MWDVLGGGWKKMVEVESDVESMLVLGRWCGVGPSFRHLVEHMVGIVA